jgi:hypothetical protein
MTTLRPTRAQTRTALTARGVPAAPRPIDRRAPERLVQIEDAERVVGKPADDAA